MTKAAYGSIDNPLRMEDAQSYPLITAGDTVHIRGGTYAGAYTFTIAGESAINPITIQPYNNEHVIIDGGLHVNGSYTHWYDIEKCFTGGVHTTDIEGSDHPQEEQSQLHLAGIGTKLINWLVYDQVADGTNWAYTTQESELYGCIFFNNGWEGPDRGHGHAIYTQNEATSGLKTIKHCILGPHFGMASSNLAIYEGGGTKCQNYRVTESIMIGGRQLIGGGTVNNVIVDKCHSYGDEFTLGYFSGQSHVGATIQNSNITGFFSPLNMPQFTFTNNLLVNMAATGVIVYLMEEAGIGTVPTCSGNKYHYLGNSSVPFQVETVDWFTFEEWKTRYTTDADSTYSTSIPATNSTHVFPNEYKTTRGIVVVWNWTSANSVSVDISSITGIEIGDSYTLRSALDYFGDVATGIVAGDGTITIDMRAISHTVSIPEGYTEALIATTFPIFGTFVVEKA